MELKAKLDEINKVYFPRLKDGLYGTIGDFYDGVIAPMLPEKRVVMGWQEILYDYASDPDAVFFLRRYQSAPGKDWNCIRRGFVTEYDRGGYVCCDNFFSHYIYTMAYDGYVPSLEEFRRCIADREFPYGFMSTKEERELQAYKKGKAPNLNSSGWKLAHVLPVNNAYGSVRYSTFADAHFPRGERSEWKQKPEGYSAREVGRGMSHDERSVLRAHFLRLASPINHFLVPKKNNETDLLGGDIGEKSELLRYVQYRFEEMYGRDMVHDFLMLADALGDFAVSQDTSRIKIDLKCDGAGVGSNGSSCDRIRNSAGGMKVQEGKGKRQPSATTSVDGEQLNKMIRLYLEQGVSFRGLEREVLGIESQARGGGFVAKKALNDVGVTNSIKGALASESLESLIERSDDGLKRTLKQVYKR